MLRYVLPLFLIGCAGDFGPGSVVDDEMGEGGDDSGGDGAGDGQDPGALEACRRVDLVFSVDDSGSMSEEKDAIRNDVFPAFAEALIAIGDGLDDYRVGVIDACPSPASFHTTGTAGACEFSSGQSWMESSSPNLVSEFQCVGDIVSADNQCSGDNDDEQPASAAAASLEAPMISGGPNSGFLRDDALLVVVAITDEDEQPTPQASVQQVYDRLTSIKNGGVEQMVFLGIGGSSDCEGVYGEADNASDLKDLTSLFEAQGRGLFWDLCGGNLEDGLTEAMVVIESACEDFDPDACNNPDGCEPGDGSGPGDGGDPPQVD